MLFKNSLPFGLKRLFLLLFSALGFPAFSQLPYPEPNQLEGTALRLAKRLTEWTERSSEEKIYLMSDRTLYKPDEDIWVAAFVRDAVSLRKSAFSDIVYVELINTRGTVMESRTLIAKNGLAAADFHLPQGIPGGIYKLKAYTKHSEGSEAVFERELTVQAAVLPRLNMKLQFEKEAYGKGGEVVARLDLSTLQNAPLPQQAVNFEAMLDGKKISAGKETTSTAGRVYLRFRLPENLNTNDGLLNVMISYNGQTESISRAIPITLGNIDLQFFPEGGELVVGLNNRVAFKAVNEFGKPADVKGRIYDQSGQFVAAFESYHDGMGATDFIPAVGKTYYAEVLEPIGAEGKYSLPKVVSGGVALQVEPETRYNKVNVNLQATGNQELTVVLTQRGEIRQSQIVQTNAYQQQMLQFSTEYLQPGIAQVTVFNNLDEPIAERLVFCGYNKTLNIKVTTDKEKYIPREQVKMQVQVTDDQGKPVSGDFALAVADDKNITFADDKQQHLLAAMLLQSDLKGEIHEPNFYFDKEEEKSFAALDYLLLTQGWRRYEWKAIVAGKKPAANDRKELALIEGTVTNSEGKPVRNATVSINARSAVDMTDEQGKFSIAGYMLYKSEELLVEFPDGSRETMRIAEYGSNYQIGQAAIKGIVMEKDSKIPLPYTNVQLKKKSNNAVVQAMVTNEEGVFEFKNVPHDEYNLQVQMVGYAEHNVADLKFTGKPIKVNPELTPEYLLLESVTVTTARPGVTRAKGNRREVETRMGAEPPVPMMIPQARAMDVEVDAMMIDDNVVIGENAGAMVQEEIEVVQREARQTTDKLPATFIDGILVEVPIKDFDQRARRAAEAEKKKEEAANKRDAAQGAMVMPAAKPMPAPGVRYQKSRTFYIPVYDKKPVEVRTDFRPTIYWNPQVSTNANGKADLTFYNSDEVTQFRVTVEGFSQAGGIGRAEYRYFTQKPFSIDAKLPERVVTGDRISIPLLVSNNQDFPLDARLVLTTPAHFQAVKGAVPTIQVPANKTTTIFLEYIVGDVIATGDFIISLETPNGKDVIRQTMETQPRGFPVKETYTKEELRSTFPLDIVNPLPGSIQATVSIAPSVIGDCLAGLEKMLRQPNGCFEQTSSGNYPNILVLQYLRETGTVNAELEKQAQAYLDFGYKKLLTYEIKGGGFDIWGTGPAHEGLTAYGLIQFYDMKSVYPVEQDLLDRTAKFLLTRRKGDGSWNNDNKNGHGFIDDPQISDAYLVYAMAETGNGKGISKEVDKSYNDAVKSEDPYVMALMVNALLAMNDKRGNELLTELLKSQNADGSFEGTRYSITHSQGFGFKIETTALVATALMRTNQNGKPLEEAMKFIAKGQTPYGFGSTQSTVMALRALAKYAKFSKRVGEDGVLVVKVNGKEVERQAYKAEQTEPLVLSALSKHLVAGKNTVEAVIEGAKNAIPVTLDLNYTTTLPSNFVRASLKFDTRLSTTNAKMGETVRLTSTFSNISKQVQASPMLMVGIPAGLSLQPWQLKELMDKKVFDYYEIFDGYAVFHYTKIDMGETKTVNLDLKADIPGTWEAPASSAFIYYTPEDVVWSAPAKLTVAP